MTQRISLYPSGGSYPTGRFNLHRRPYIRQKKLTTEGRSYLNQKGISHQRNISELNIPSKRSHLPKNDQVISPHALAVKIKSMLSWLGPLIFQGEYEVYSLELLKIKYKFLGYTYDTLCPDVHAFVWGAEFFWTPLQQFKSFLWFQFYHYIAFPGCCMWRNSNLLVTSEWVIGREGVAREWRAARVVSAVVQTVDGWRPSQRGGARDHKEPVPTPICTQIQYPTLATFHLPSCHPAFGTPQYRVWGAYTILLPEEFCNSHPPTVHGAVSPVASPLSARKVKGSNLSRGYFCKIEFVHGRRKPLLLFCNFSKWCDFENISHLHTKSIEHLTFSRTTFTM